MGGYSDSDKQNILRNKINSMTLGTFGTRNELERKMGKQLTRDERSYLTSPEVNTYYQNQIDIIWEQQCLEKIKQKINQYNYDIIYFSSRNDLLYTVQYEFNDVNQSLFENNQIINELNHTWNNIETKIKRLKEKIEFKIKDILLYNNDSINSQYDLESIIREEFEGADRRLLENRDMDNYLRRNIRRNWSKIFTNRRKKLEEKIKGISGIFLAYKYCQTKDEFKTEIENNFLDDNDRNNINAQFKIIFQNTIDKYWIKLENIKSEGIRKKKEEEKEIDSLWIELFDHQNELLKEMKERYEQKISEFEDKLQNREEKDKEFKELRIKTELESRKKKPNKFEHSWDNETPGKSICKSVKEDSIVNSEFNKLWDEFLRAQKELDVDLIKKNDEFGNKLIKTIENIKVNLGKYDEKTKDMLEKLIESNANDFINNLQAFRERFEKELEKEKELLNEEYNHEIKKYEKLEEKK